jgi:hypothetical protein
LIVLHHPKRSGPHLLHLLDIRARHFGGTLDVVQTML